MELLQKTSRPCRNYIDCYAGLVLTILFCGTVIAYFIIWQNCQITKLGTPYDINADVCGELIYGRDLLYYPNPNNLQFPICIDKCPTGKTKGGTFAPNEDGSVATFPLTETKLFLGHYCLPSTVQAEYLKDALSEKMKHQVFFQDMFKSAELFFVVVFVSFLLFFFTLSVLSDRHINAVLPACLKLLPMLFSIGLSAWILYAIRTERVHNAIAFWMLITALILCSIIVTLVPFLFPETFERSKLTTLLGIQAIQEMPDLLICIAVASIGVGILTILCALSSIQLLSIGRFIPAPLRIKSSDSMGAIGIAGSFELSAAQYFLCGILFLSLRFFVETVNAFLKFLTVKCVKLWFEIPPTRGVRSPSCDIALRALKGSINHLPPISTAAIASFFRFPSMIVQFVASERVASHDLNKTASKLYGYLEPFERCRTLYNPSSFLKLSDASGCCYVDCAAKSHMEIVHGVAPDHQAGKKYRVEEMVSSSFNLVLFYTLFLLISLLSWIVLQFCPAFSAQGEKELFSTATPLCICMILAGSILLILYESLEVTYVTIILLWFKATSDLVWDSGINSDTIVEFESRTLSQYVQYMQRSANVL